MPSFDMIGEYGDLSGKNQLIHGDNLDALRVIADDFETHPDAEKIKCIYIDPPYNTRKELKNYSDNFDRNEWQVYDETTANIDASNFLLKWYHMYSIR